MFNGCYLDKYVLVLLISLICIFLIQKYNQKKILKIKNVIVAGVDEGIILKKEESYFYNDILLGIGKLNSAKFLNKNKFLYKELEIKVKNKENKN